MSVFLPPMLNLFASSKSKHTIAPVSIKKRLSEVHRILLIYPIAIPQARVARYTLARLTILPNPFEIYVAVTDHILENVKIRAQQVLPIHQSPRHGEITLDSIESWPVQNFDALVCLEPEPQDDLMALVWQIQAPVTIGFSDGIGKHRFTVELVKKHTEFLENSYGSVLGLFGLKSVRK